MARVRARFLAGGLMAVVGSLAGASAMTQGDATGFRVVILQSTATPPEPGDLSRVFGRAREIFADKTGQSLIRVAVEDVGRGNPEEKAKAYIAAHRDRVPDGILVLSDDDESVEYGGYSFNVVRPRGDANRYPAPELGDRFVYVAVIDFAHKYARCGYNNRGVRVSDVSRGGECRGERGLQCVDNGRYWQCPATLEDPNSNFDYFMGCVIVHEFAHPFGTEGDDDHYRTPVCAARMGFTPAQSADERAGQLSCTMCPDIYGRIKPRDAGGRAPAR